MRILQRTAMTELREKMAIGHIASFFGTREGSLSCARILVSYGFSELSGKSKTEQLAQVMAIILHENRLELLKFLNTLLRFHRLDSQDWMELDSYLTSLGFQVESQKIVEIPPKEDFFKIIEGFLQHPLARPALEGLKNGAIITLCEKINGMTSDFTLVDYGCGPGRLIYGLNIIDEKALSKMTYVGVDKNKDYLKSIEQEAIKGLGFDRKIKSHHILTPEQFFETDQIVNFVFLINVLHEIPLRDLPITLKELDWKLRKDGHMIVHEMIEPPEPEMGFVPWEPDDFVSVFDGTSLKPHVHAYETKSGIPLVNVDLVKTVDERTKYEKFVFNLFRMYREKLDRVDKQLSAIKESGIKSKKYAFLLVLKDNIETQIQEFRDFPEVVDPETMNHGPPFCGEITCGNCGGIGNLADLKLIEMDVGWGFESFWGLCCSHCGKTIFAHRPEDRETETSSGYSYLYRQT